MRNNWEAGRRKINIFTSTLTEKKNTKKKTKPDSEITQEKAHSKALEVVLEGEMQARITIAFTELPLLPDLKDLALHKCRHGA